MDHHSGLTLVLQNLQKHRQLLEQDITGGSCDTYEEYRYKCGKIESIYYAEQEILDMLERIEIS